MMKGWPVSLALMALAPFAALAEESESDVSPVALMSIEDGALSGEGGNLIRAHLANAQFIMIGEEHGFADAPQIGLAVAKAAWPYGLRHHVVEVGPHSTRWASDILREAGVDGLAAALEGRPVALPFLSLREDAELAKYFLDNRGRLWGVDQEFIGSAIIQLEALHDLASGDAAKASIASLVETEQNAFATGNQGAAFMFTATTGTFDELRAHFLRNNKAAEIISSLEESAWIYQLFAQGRNFKSNTDRVALIKAQFMDHYDAARGSAPRALFKMGVNHVGLGSTFLNTFDIGSLAEGVAATNDMSVLRLLIVPLSGRQNQIRPSASGFFSAVDFESDLTASLLQAAGVETDSVPENGWAVISLAPVRLALGQKGLNALSPEARFAVLGFDFLITTRGAKPATPLAD